MKNKRIVILLGIVALSAIGWVFYKTFCPFAEGVKKDSIERYPYTYKLNDTTIIIIKETGKADTIINSK